ncbi:MAG: hypothetical protein ACI9J3_000728 [Parvicellaceae bacterium]|jgi:hypothetical protein
MFLNPDNLKNNLSLSILAFLVVIVSACTEEAVVIDPIPVTEVVDTVFVVEKLNIAPNDFPSNFNQTIWNILEEGKVCTPDSSNYQTLFCSSDLFRVFPLGKNKDYSEGLICESRSLMFNGGISKNVVVLTKNRNDKAVKVDHFLGKLLDLETDPSGYYKLIMSYRDSQIGTIAVSHEFEDGYYKPKEVVEINDYFVKEEAKDSLYNYYLKDFRWGH